MADRLTVPEFFAALRSQGVQPLIDTPEVRKRVLANVQSLTAHYPIKDRWPVLDLESSYERILNNSPALLNFVTSYCYRGFIKLHGFDETYSMDEWFGDFTVEYRLNDTSEIRMRMQAVLGPGNSWPASGLYQAYQEATKFRAVNLLKSIFR